MAAPLRSWGPFLPHGSVSAPFFNWSLGSSFISQLVVLIFRLLVRGMMSLLSKEKLAFMDMCPFQRDDGSLQPRDPLVVDPGAESVPAPVWDSGPHSPQRQGEEWPVLG